MAKCKSSNRNGIAGKIVAGALALAVAAGSICCIGFVSRDASGKWFGNSDLGSWHWADNGLNAGNGNGGSIIADGEANGMQMSSTVIPLNSYEEYGVSALAENAYSLSVTYTPEDTTFQETTYSAKFKDGTDCSAYATVSQSTAGSKTATLTILKPFSKQIVVTATCNRNTAIKATTTVDYVCTNLGIYINDYNIDAQNEIMLACVGWSNGTVIPVDDNNTKFVYDAGASFVSSAQSAGFTVERYYSEKVYFNEGDFTSIDGNMNSIKSIYYSLGNYSSMTTTQKQNYRLFLGRYFANDEDGDCIGHFGFTYNRVYNGVDYGGITIDNVKWQEYDSAYNIHEAFQVEASSMSTNSPSIIAG